MGLTKETLDYQELLDILHGKSYTYDSALIVVHKGNTAEVYIKQPKIEIGNQQKSIHYERVYDTYQIADYINSRNGYKTEVIHVGSTEIIPKFLNYSLLALFAVILLVLAYKDKGEAKISLEFCAFLISLVCFAFLLLLLVSNNSPI